MFSSLRKRLASLLIPAIVLSVLIHEVFTTPVYSERELSAMREQAVGMARQGNFEEALERLRALSEVAPKNRLVWGDYLLVQIRAGQAAAAAAVAQARANPKRELPDYALAELFTAALQLGDRESARAFARREIAQSANATSVAVAREQALALAEPTPVPAQDAVVTAPAAVDNPPSPMPANQDNNPAVTRAIHVTRMWASPRPKPHPVLAPNMTSVPASPAANPPVETLPTDILPAETSPAEAARAAVRAAESAPPAERAAYARIALAKLADCENYLQATNGPAIERRNVRLDRVRALTLAAELDDAAAEFEAVDNAELPLFGLLNGADLYSRRREPERARQLLDRAESMAPDSRQVVVARFYNALDREQYGEAKLLLGRVQSLSQPGREQRDAEATAAMFDAYQNWLDGAQRRLESLVAANPGAADLQLQLALIYRWRGWSQRALETYRSVQSPADPFAPRLGEMAAMVDLKQLGAAHVALDKLAAEAPEHPDVQQAVRAAAQRNRAEYSAQILTGRSTGSPVTGSGDLAFEQRLYSAPLADQYRVFAHQRYDWADFPEGSGSADRLGVGADYRSQFVDAAIEIGERLPAAQWGGTVSGEWRPDDYWAVFGEAQSDSSAIPLRALRAGIDGYSLTVGGRYRASESRDAKVAYSYTDFSDGNQRKALSARVRQSVFESAHHQVAAIVQAYYGTNSADDNVPYFNPSREQSFGVAMEYSGILLRRYERSWSQRLVLGAGNYAQAGHANGLIWDAEYEQRWQFNDALSVNYGLLHRSRIYDGNREGYSAIIGGLNWRF